MNNEDLASYLNNATQTLTYGADLKQLILTIAQSSVEVAQLLADANLVGDANKLDSVNVQGEQQMQLDVLSNQRFVEAFKASKVVAGLVSEELTEAMVLSEAVQAPFLVSFDPLDGSSNIAVNGVVGSIFSILPVPKRGTVSPADFLQAGQQQLAALYVIYGPALMLVLTVGQGTVAFTFNRARVVFELTHAPFVIAPTTSEFAINASNERFWQKPVKRYIAECIDGTAGVRGRNFNMRWTASMVADVHRILMRGGVFLYPQDQKLPAKKGRLRLLYEANPMSLLIEQAQGKSSTGRMRILDILPTDIHERAPVILGAAEEVTLLDHYHQLYQDQ